MPKKILIFCDGTWNRRDKRANGSAHPTNVVKLMRAVAPTDRNHTAQVVYYDAGVGTRGVWDKLVGGAFGVGLSLNIQEAYRFIANNYTEGDQIFLFGFSRGAYTVRSLSGLIGAVGLLPKSSLAYVPEAYKYYRTPPQKRGQSQYKTSVFLQIPESRRTIAIKFLGVWDTVGALGIPVRGLSRLSRSWVGFHNTELSGKINFAYHALAIDEKRRPFAPDLWTTQEPVHANREVLQVWFPGVHSNIGGGYPERGLSDAALAWMARRAEHCGLELDPAFLTETVKPDPCGVLVDSFTWPYRIVSRVPGARPYSRPIGSDAIGGRHGSSTLNEMIHESAVERVHAPEKSYEPKNLVAAFSTVPVFSEPGAKRRPFVKRRHIREIGNWSGNLILTNARESCRILDFCAGEGAKIQASATLSVGSSVELDSELTGRIPTTVVWQQQDRMGLQFMR